MTRYFMTIPEAAWLILDAAALGKAGDMFVLDMGEPIHIVDLATDLARLAGRDPESVPIQIIGLRPGEKLTEELFYKSEHVEPTASPKIMRVSSGPPPPGIRAAVRSLLMLASGEDDETVRRTLFGLVNGERLTKPPVAQAPWLVPVMTDPSAGRSPTGARSRATREATMVTSGEAG